MRVLSIEGTMKVDVRRKGADSVGMTYSSSL